ncbi:MAG: transcription factor S [Candidatus Woesearchaeota archaeon]|nr:transcription factor S [Candidatus Woesearchaeota archaeon]MDP7181898.1 transcription factor S [Candidatus Woesearchaeota archaeon]MDP7199213.1 transcription factor S [Candidatus Woesearchaeota archaeon]MDP7467826.1 transcription factor S [Candidatus Woesearchaeota archaeon]MDP7647816.1 transcription factor S [Candidatus Woesearchaeota archaeon]
MLMFCPKCKGMLLPKVVSGKKTLGCSCGYTSDSAVMSGGSAAKDERVEGALKEQENLPLTDAECAKCKHQKAYHWSKQTRAGDEPETRFFRCEMCKHTWREYS